MDKHLHIVSFNVPWPADYGGVIDVYYRIRELWTAGVKIHLHCFTYGRKPAEELQQYCEEVNYYRRKMGPCRWLFDKRPYIVSSRYSKALVERLCNDDYPILLEGLHCCGLVTEIKQKNRNRKIFVRAHNVEHDYYHGLMRVERNRFRKFYFQEESKRLRTYEPILRNVDEIWAISENDKQYFEERNYCGLVRLVLPTLPLAWSGLTGKGDYWLYQGNLSVGENIDAVKFLVNELGKNKTLKGVVAGKNPSENLRKLIAKYDNIILRANPDEIEMNGLIKNAHVNVLATRQSTGLKLKLIKALTGGRFCLVNKSMVENTGFESLCVVAKESDFPLQLDRLMTLDFDESEKNNRISLLGQVCKGQELRAFVEGL